MKVIAVLFVLVAAVAANKIKYIGGDAFRWINGRVECRRNCVARDWNSCELCPMPDLNPTCPAPNCNIGANTQYVFPHPDPTMFWQCERTLENGEYGWRTIERNCGCMTLFNYAEQACIHPRDWSPDCPGVQNPNAVPNACELDCQDC
ncbi:CLUMA_CG002640, isoform A [Clunio marinus]|uniref:CLUMA_CG002640, isoform A n=1 Tax=Clunio marinus TaxID=568069 RepID=A0A1J1HL05_9DIPT|nr:CLUMA_CG002640, isoform A [Clunio marinus]